MLKTTSARLSAALLGYFTLVIILLTLNPFRFAIPKQVAFTFDSDLANFISNIVLFLPIGFFYRPGQNRVRGALTLGFGLSLGIEIVQLFIPARTPSLIDLLANTLGALIGEWFNTQYATRLRMTPGMAGRLRLETPLMGLMYLVLPLLWANIIASRFSSRRWMLTALIILCIAVGFSQLYRHWRDHPPLRAGLHAALATGLWSLAGVGPTLLFSLRIRLIALAFSGLAGLLALLPRPAQERRFERATLTILIPLFLLYMLGLTTYSFSPTWATFHFLLGFTTSSTETSLQRLFPRVEYLLAFTILGYLLAEWRGRAELSFKQDLPRLLGQAAGVALVLELLSGFQAGLGASPIRAGLAILGALFGGSIYHAFRAHIRFLLGR